MPTSKVSFFGSFTILALLPIFAYSQSAAFGSYCEASGGKLASLAGIDDGFSTFGGAQVWDFDERQAIMVEKYGHHRP